MLQYKAYPVKDWEKHNAKLKRDDCDRHSKEGHGPEYAGRALDEWAYRKGIKLSFIRPGKPIENAFAESFNQAA
jgi:transposase InsO family protein